MRYKGMIVSWRTCRRGRDKEGPVMAGLFGADHLKERREGGMWIPGLVQRD